MDDGCFRSVGGTLSYPMSAMNYDIINQHDLQISTRELPTAGLSLRHLLPAICRLPNPHVRETRSSHSPYCTLIALLPPPVDRRVVYRTKHG